jgi:hypothetical protein
VAGGIVFTIVMAIGIPVGVMLAGALWSAIFGWVSSEQAQADAEVAAGG